MLAGGLAGAPDQWNSGLLTQQTGFPEQSWFDSAYTDRAEKPRAEERLRQQTERQPENRVGFVPTVTGFRYRH